MVNHNNKKTVANVLVNNVTSTVPRGLGKLCSAVLGLTISTISWADYDVNLAALLDSQGLAQEVAIGDVSGDGLNDMVLVNNGYGTGNHTNHALIYLGRDGGAIAAPIAIAYSDHVSGDRGLVLMNVDSDDALEVVVGHDRQLSVINQTGEASFSTFNISTNDRNHVLGAIDVNLDGQAELVSVPTSGSFKPAVFYDVFTWLPILELDVSGQGGQFEMATIDVNNDGLDDLLLANKGSSAFIDLSVLLHNGVGGFLPLQTHALSGQHAVASGLATGDFNGDGLNDVILTQDIGTEAALFLQDGFGDLFWADTVPTAPLAELAQAHDLNDDGLTDVALLHNQSNQTAATFGFILQGEAGLSGEQLTPLPSPLVYSMQSVALGDVNNDDCSDAIIADHNQGLMVFHGSGCQAGADLSVGLEFRNNQWVATVDHVTGSSVQGAWLDVVISSPDHLRLYTDGCRLRSDGRGTILGRCYIGAMTAGTSQNLVFRTDPSQSVGALRNVRFTATVSSEQTDPDLNNNTAVHQIRR